MIIIKPNEEMIANLAMPGIDGISRIHFIYIEGIGYVADRNICTEKSYDYLNQRGYVEGRKLTFSNRKGYLCRILTTTEWDKIMAYNNSDDLWHWHNKYSWVRSTDLESSGSGMTFIRGYSSAGCVFSQFTKVSNHEIGFRPVLVPMDADEKQPNNPQTEKKINAVYIGGAYGTGLAEELLQILSYELKENIAKLNEYQEATKLFENSETHDYVIRLAHAIRELGTDVSLFHSSRKNRCTGIHGFSIGGEVYKQKED